MKLLLIAVALIASTAILGANSNPDASFYKKAAEGGLAEVELGNLAQKKSADQSVKDFGAMMVKDHSAANDKLKALADSKSIKLPTKPSVGQMASKTKLEVLSGKTFDKSYIRHDRGSPEGHQRVQERSRFGPRPRCQSLCSGYLADSGRPFDQNPVYRQGRRDQDRL